MNNITLIELKNKVRYCIKPLSRFVQDDGIDRIRFPNNDNIYYNKLKRLNKLKTQTQTIPDNEGEEVSNLNIQW